MKSFFTFLLIVLIGSVSLAQTQVPYILAIKKDSLDQPTTSQSYANWKELKADTLLSKTDYEVKIYGKQGELLEPAFENTAVRSLSTHPTQSNILYVGLKGNNPGDGKVATSLDYGQSWTYLNIGTPLSAEAEDVQCIEFSPHYTQHIWAGTWKHGLYHSTNGGTSFKKVESFPSNDIRAIAFHDNHPEKLAVATTSHGVVSTIDGGKTWTFKDSTYRSEHFERLWNMKQHPIDKNMLFAMTMEQGLHKSTDFGNTWAKVAIAKGQFIWDLDFNPLQEVWYIGTDFKTYTLHRSKDEGTTFEQILTTNSFHQLKLDRNKANEIVVYLAGEFGLYLYEKGAFTELDYLLPSPNLTEMLIVNGKLIVATWGNGLIEVKR